MINSFIFEFGCLELTDPKYITNENIYKFFNITTNEIKLIESSSM